MSAMIDETTPHTQKQKYHRSWRNVFVAKRFQLRLIAYFTAIGLVLASFYTGILAFFSRATFQSLLGHTMLGAGHRAALLDAFDQLLLRTAAFSAVFVLLCALVALMISHRMAGPLYNLRRCLERVQTGDLDVDCHFRKDDDHRELADAFNGAMETVRSRVDKS
jgi:methyl-accepting chemotaxis protein